MTSHPLRLDGKCVAQHMKALCQRYHLTYQQKYGRPVSFGVISIGHHEPSRVYIAHKKKIAGELGFEFQEKHFEDTEDPLVICKEIAQYSTSLDGVILQLPISAAHNPDLYLSSIPIDRDIDGLHPHYTGHVIPCTPLGCLILLRAYGINPAKKRVVVVGRSQLVGRPLALLMLDHNATVTVVHRGTPHVQEITRQADILLVCAGHRHLITQDHVSPHTVVVDVGIHRFEGKLTGDVDPKVRQYVQAFSPVPGGVGPMTVISLMWNTLSLAFQKKGEILGIAELLKEMKDIALSIPLSDPTS